jgi:hypothetical protein
LAIRSCLMVAPISMLIKKYCGIPYNSFLGSQALPLAVALLIAVPVGLTANFAEPRIGSFPTLLSCGLAGILLYGLVLRIAWRGQRSAPRPWALRARN